MVRILFRSALSCLTAGCVAASLAVLPSDAAAHPVERSAPAAAETILLVRGTIKGEQERRFTREEFEAIGMATLTTRTPWNQEPVAFSGIKLSAFLRHVGATKARMLRVTALNDYVTTIPVEDVAHDPILATRRNGKVMAVRDKGPIFVIYPFDQDKSLNSELYFSRSAWQVKSIEIE